MAVIAFSTGAPLVKRTLVAAFAELPELEGVQVTYNDPLGGMEKEVVYLGKITWGERASSTNGEDWSELGAMAKKEVFRIQLAINVQAEGESGEAVETRAFELMAAIEIYLRSNSTITYAKMTSFHIIPGHVGTYPIPDGQECQIIAFIHCNVNK